MSQSGLAESLWSHFASPGALQDFLQYFSQRIACFAELVALLVGSATFVGSFSACERPSKVKIEFIYSPPRPLGSALATDPRHLHFESSSSFNGVFDLKYSLDLVRGQLKNILPRDDFHSEIDIEMLLQGQLIGRGQTVRSLTSGQNLTIQFHIALQPLRNLQVDSLSETLRGALQESAKTGLDAADPAHPTLRLLKLFYALRGLHSAAALEATVFQSAKLTGLLSHQAPWTQSLFLHCPFLFQFSARYEHFYSSQGTARSSKQRLRVCRGNLLENALGIFSDAALLKSGPLEVEFEGEPGTGVGPTNEFFSLVSGEIRGLGIWRVQQEYGLFPAPVPSPLEVFHTLGKFVGKALLDRKQVDLPFNEVWWKLVFSQPVNSTDLHKVDPLLANSLLQLTHCESLELTFLLPGYDTVELKSHGRDTTLTPENLSEYTELVTRCTLLQTAQVQAFRSGLETLLPQEALQLFTAPELEELLCGASDGCWGLATLRAQVLPSHGYSSESPTFTNLLSLMAEFTPKEREEFLLFITGCPRLPLGGFAKLRPKLTVVRKESGGGPDESLPSVMTCQNYLKLPEYSSAEVLRRRLRLALTEGGRTFYLS